VRVDPFAILGLPRRYDLDKAALDRRYRDLQQALHPDKYTAAGASERALTLGKAMEVNEAYRVLRDDQARAEALLSLLGGAADPHEPADPELLMEMMELREALSEAREQGQAEKVAALAADVGDKTAAARDELARLFAAVGGEPKLLAQARALTSRMRYYRRFLDEVALFEDEALP
jgi:molecular chaperone HscB